MKRTPVESIGEVLDRLKKEQNLQSRLQEREAVRLWATVVGPGMARQVHAVDVSRGTLLLQCQSSPLRQELMLSRDALLGELNRLLGEDLVKNIRFV